MARKARRQAPAPTPAPTCPHCGHELSGEELRALAPAARAAEQEAANAELLAVLGEPEELAWTAEELAWTAEELAVILDFDAGELLPDDGACTLCGTKPGERRVWKSALPVSAGNGPK